jgi:hypothetical protein
MRTHQMSSSRSRTVGAASIEEMSDRSSARRRVPRRIGRRELLALPAALALLVPATPALASTGTSGYNQKPPVPTTKTEPKTGTAPSKESATPAASAEPAAASTTPTVTTKASTLPFTGLNLTWVVGAGLLLLAAGLAIRLVLRPGAGR